MNPAYILAFALGFTVAWALACAAIFVTVIQLSKGAGE